MAPQTMVNDFSDPVDKSDKELLHEELQIQLTRILKGCTRHRAYALPIPECLDDEQGTEDTNLLAAVQFAEEIIAVGEGHIEAFKWDLVGDILNPGVTTTQAFKKACYIRYEHLLANKTSSLLGLANLYEQREKLRKQGIGSKGDNGVEPVLPMVPRRRRPVVSGNGLFVSSSPGTTSTTMNALADESLLKKVQEMKSEDIQLELKLRGLKCNKGAKAELISRLKAARCEAYRSEEATWAGQLTDSEFDRLAQQTAVQMPKQETREALKAYLYENPTVKVELEAELAKPVKPKKSQRGPQPPSSQYPKLITTTEEPLRLRRLLLKGYPAHTTEYDIRCLMKRYGVLTPIQQGAGEFFCDCDTPQNAKQAVKELSYHIVNTVATRCVLYEEYLAEKRQQASKAKAAAAKKENDSSASHKRKIDSELMVDGSAKKPKNV